MSASQSRIGQVNVTEEGRLVEVEFEIDGKRYPVYFRSNGRPLTGNIESFVGVALLPCMKTGTELAVNHEVSPRFLAALETIQDIYCCWDSTMRRVKILGATPRVSSPSTEGRAASCFSGGVDSFYTFLRHRDEITDLVFVHGFDIRLGRADRIELFERTSQMVRAVASHFGKNVIGIETNVRSVLDPYVDWGELGHGAGLAAIGHLLTPAIRRFYIPSTHTYADMFPWGSHPVLDPLRSTETCEFIHDGCGATRIDKVALISQSDVALQNLRVCYHNYDGAYNCGRCEKCLRTMINLEVVGALGRCTTFDRPLDIRRVRKIEAFDENTRTFVMENLRELEKVPSKAELRRALQHVMNRPKWPARIRDRIKRRAKQYPQFYQFLRRLRRD
jgi:hypothetical protein